MQKIVKFVLIIILNLIIFFLTVRITETILQKSENKVKNAKIIRLNKETLNFPKTENGLKYFYEPQPNNLRSWKPNWLGFEVINTINSDTLNERFEYPVQRPANYFRIITLGDSNIYGLYIETPFNYPEKLEDLLNSKLKCSNYNHFDVLNLGVPGYDIEYSAERFIKRGIKYDPDLVIWLVNEWNFDIINEYNIPKMKEYNKEGYKDFDIANKKFTATELALKELNDMFSSQEIFDYQKKAIERLIKKYKGKILFVSYPSLPEKYKKLIYHFTQSNQNKYVYSYKLTDLLKNDNYHLLDFHPNKKGYQKMSGEIFDYLANIYFKNCNRSDK